MLLKSRHEVDLVPKFKPYLPRPCGDIPRRRFWHKTALLGLCLTQLPPNISRCPWRGTMLSELPTPSQDGGQKLPSLDCMCWRFKFWLSGLAQRTRAGSRLQDSSSRGRSRGHARSPLTPPKRKDSAHGLFLSQAGFLG